MTTDREKKEKRRREEAQAFVKELEQLVKDEERATLATLRRSFGRENNHSFEADRWLFHALPYSLKRTATVIWAEQCFRLVATLFAWYQMGSDDLHESAPRPPNFGASFAEYRAKLIEKTKSDGRSVEKRLAALLNANRDDLRMHLKQAVSLLKSYEVPIDWAALLIDLRKWEYGNRQVQRKWSRAFWQFVEFDKLPEDVSIDEETEDNEDDMDNDDDESSDE